MASVCYFARCILLLFPCVYRLSFPLCSERQPEISSEVLRTRARTCPALRTRPGHLYLWQPSLSLPFVDPMSLPLLCSQHYKRRPRKDLLFRTPSRSRPTPHPSLFSSPSPPGFPRRQCIILPYTSFVFYSRVLCVPSFSL